MSADPTRIRIVKRSPSIAQPAASSSPSRSKRLRLCMTLIQLSGSAT